MFAPGKALFLGGRHDLPVTDQRGGAVVVIGGNAEGGDGVAHDRGAIVPARDARLKRAETDPGLALVQQRKDLGGPLAHQGRVGPALDIEPHQRLGV